MGIRRLALCVGIGALSFASFALADPITVIVDTSNAILSGHEFILDFELTSSTDNTVTISSFAIDSPPGSYGALIPPTDGVSGPLPGDVVLGGVPYSVLLQPVTLGTYIQFTFEATNDPVQDPLLYGPDRFTFAILDTITLAPPVDDEGNQIGDPVAGFLVTYDFGIDSPVLALYSPAAMPAALVPEPGILALLSIAFVALAIGLSRAPLRFRA